MFQRFPRKKGNKYNAKKTEVDGIKFHSKLESNHYIQLRDAGIENIRQQNFILQEGFRFNGRAIRPIGYRCDLYVKRNERIYVLDSKGMADAQYKIKAKMLLKHFNHEVICIGSMKKMVVVISMIKSGNSTDEIIKAIETKKKVKK